MIHTPERPQKNNAVARYHCNPSAYAEWRSWYEEEYGVPSPEVSCFRTFAPQLIQPNHTVLDLGAGAGIVGQTLKTLGHTGRRIANDIAPEMVGYSHDCGFYDDGYSCDCVQVVAELERRQEQVDWGVALLLLGYLSPSHTARLVRALYRVCRVGLIFSVEVLTRPEEKDGEITKYSHSLEELKAATGGYWSVRPLVAPESPLVLFTPKLT